MSDYSSQSIQDALEDVGVVRGDTLFMHMSLGRLGLLEGQTTLDGISQVFLDACLKVLGPTGTLLVPTYTYSIGKREIFDLENTPSTVGPFTEYIRRLPYAVRSMEPMLAVSGLGPKANSLLLNLPPTSYGYDSVYHRLRKIHAKICTVGVGLHWATFRHHIEEMAKVPFRRAKLFQGSVRSKGIVSPISWSYFAAPFLDCCNPNGKPLEDIVRKNGTCRSAALGRGEILAIDAQTYFEEGMREMTRNPWITARGPVPSKEELLAAKF